MLQLQLPHNSTNMDFSCIHFYKHMNGFFMHSISLPEKLTRQLAHLVGKLLELKRPSGGTWYVGLIKSGDKLILQPGWNDFASDNNISQNDHLVFKFVGESRFEVFIFESAGCEKGGNLAKDEHEQDESLGSIVGVELPKEVHNLAIIRTDERPEIQHRIETSLLNMKKPSTDEEQEASEASNDSMPLEELRSILYQKRRVHKNQGEMKMQRPSIAAKLPSKNIEESKETSNDLLPIVELLRIKSQKNKLSSEIQNKKETPPVKKRPRQHPRKFSLTDEQHRKSVQTCYSNYQSKGPWTTEQRSRAQQLTSKVQPKNPYFHKIVVKYNVTSPCRMIIPKKFSADQLEREKLELILYRPDQGKTWYATSHFNSHRNEQILQGPTWEKFVKENKLQLGDVCMFELVKTAKRLTFVVHISLSTNISPMLLTY